MKKQSFFGKAYTALGRALSLEPLFNTGGSNGGSQRLYTPRNGGPNANVIGGFSRIRAYSRDIELVLESMGRASVGGQGKVMVAGENTGKYLDANYINQGFYELGNRDITVYVRKLKQLFGWY